MSKRYEEVATNRYKPKLSLEAANKTLEDAKI